jgi:hypothetical protein
VFGDPVFEGQRWVADELHEGIGGVSGFAFADVLEGIGYAFGDMRGDAGPDQVLDRGFDADVDDAERAIEEFREDFDSFQVW